MESCKTCKFVHVVTRRQYKIGEGGVGTYELGAECTEHFCRRFPPQVAVVTAYQERVTSIPRVTEEDWCGEYETKPEST